LGAIERKSFKECRFNRCCKCGESSEYQQNDIKITEISKPTFSGFFVKHKETKSLNAAENGPSNTGGLALGIRKRTRIG